MGLIKIENDSSNERTGAVLAGPHPLHSIGIHGDILDLVVAGRIGKIEQDPIGINRGFNRGYYRSTQSDFNAQVAAFSRRRHTLHRHRPGGVLCRGTRQQEHQGPNLFLNCRHSLLTLAGAPPAA